MRGLSALNSEYHSVQHGFILESDRYTLFCADKLTRPDESTITYLISASCHVKNLPVDVQIRLLAHEGLRRYILDHVEEAVLEKITSGDNTQYLLLGKGFKYVYNEAEFNDSVYVV